MKKFLFVLSFFNLFIFVNLNAYGNENKILLKINEEIITSYDIMTEIKYLEIINKDYSNLETNQKIELAKKSLIKEKVKEIELKKLLDKLEIENDLLDDLSIKYFEKLGINSISEFNQFFSQKEIGPKIIKHKITLEVLWNQLIYAKFINRVKIDKNKIENELKKNNKQFEYLLSEILFNLDQNEKLINKFNQIKIDINKSNFSNAALKHSNSETSKNGGKLGWIKSSVLSPNITKELKKINKGKFTEPIVIPGGFLILKIENIREIENDLNMEDEMKIIIKKKTDEQLNQFSNVYFNRIKKDINIYEL